MKKILIGTMLLLTLSTSLVSCRSFDADNGRYGYYNNQVDDRNNERNVTKETRDRIMNSYDKAKNNVKNAIGNAADDVRNMMK